MTTVIAIIRSDSDYYHDPLLGREAVNVGAFIMLGTLFGLIVVIAALVIFLDPEARHRPIEELHR